MKYDNEHAEWVHTQTLDGGYEESGDLVAPTGWFAQFGLLDASEYPDDPAAAHAADFYAATPWLIVREDDQGFVTVLGFKDLDAYTEAWKQLTQAYLLWDAGIGDDEIGAAINGYRACALWSSTITDENGDIGESFDQVDAGLSASAQRQMRDDVVSFAVDNVDAIRSFLAVTGLGWEQIGHDFWLTRNHHGAGFRDRGAAGQAVDELVESSHAYGGCDLYLSDDGEIEVQ